MYRYNRGFLKLHDEEKPKKTLFQPTKNLMQLFSIADLAPPPTPKPKSKPKPKSSEVYPFTEQDIKGLSLSKENMKEYMEYLANSSTLKCCTFTKNK